MAINTCTITDKIFEADGSIPPFARLRFELVGWDSDQNETGTPVVAPVIEFATVDDLTGEFSITLWQNGAGLRGTHYTVMLERYTDINYTDRAISDVKLGKIQIDAGTTSADLTTLLAVPVAQTVFYQFVSPTGDELTAAELKTLYESNADTNAFDDASQLKLGGIESGADVTDTTNVAAAGALMTSNDLSDVNSAASARDNLGLKGGAVTEFVDDVAAILADTDLTYTAGQPGTVVAGDYIRTRKEGFSYEVAASGASDEHVRTAGGVLLYALEGQDGWYSADALNNDTTAIQSVLAAGGKVRIPPGTLNTAVTLTVPASGALAGVGHSSVINATADVTPVKVTGAFAVLEHFKVTESHGAHTQSGVEIGNASGTENGGRATLRGLLVTGMGADGITVRAGNLGTIADCVCTANGQDGIRFTDENADNNAWRLEGFVDLRSNTRHGAYFEGGSGSADANASRQHTGVIVAQENGGDGVKIESRSNRLEIYAEANTGEDTNLTSISKGNKIGTVEGGILDNGTWNLVEFHNGNAQYRQILRGRVLLTDADGWEISNENYTGTSRLYHDANATHKFDFDSTGAKQTLRIKNVATLADKDADDAVYPVAVQFAGAAVERDRLVFDNGDTTPDVTLSEFWLANNSSATTITTFDGGHPGQRITVFFNNGNTTIQHSATTSGIRLKGGSNKTYGQYEVAEFIRNGSGWWIEV